VIYQAAPPVPSYCKPKNVVVQWQTPNVIIKQEGYFFNINLFLFLLLIDVFIQKKLNFWELSMQVNKNVFIRIQFEIISIILIYRSK